MKIVGKLEVEDTRYIIIKLSNGCLIYQPAVKSEHTDNIFERIARGEYDEK